MTTSLQPGKLVTLRGRDWIVLPSDEPDLLMVKPLGGSDEETTGIYLPFLISSDRPKDAVFPDPTREDLGDITTAKILYDSARLAFRNGAGPFRSLAKLSFRPRSYQMVPLVMALRQDVLRLLIADDVGVGKTIEALLVVRELLERRKIERFAVLCLPHLCDQWYAEIQSKLDLEPVIIRSSTQARLDRQIQGDTSVYDYYPYQIISIDYIKSETRREVFIEQCPEFVIVDEAHSCARPAGASPTQQQRYHLLNRIAQKPNQHLALLTATPHSGKSEEFHSLLGMLDPKFASLDLPNSSSIERRDLAKHFIQRKRADVEKWMGEDTPFPERDPFEWQYDLSVAYSEFFSKILGFARKLIVPDQKDGTVKRAKYWTALALLRGVMSSPAAGIEMLTTRLTNLPATDDTDPGASQVDETDLDSNPVHDREYGTELDNTPVQVVERNDWSEYQRQQLRSFSNELSSLSNLDDDQKLLSTELILDDWLSEGFNPVVYCRYIATAKYIGEMLTPVLKKKYPQLDMQVITSEIPDELRKQHIEDMRKSPKRVLIATDCLSEGINLQDYFTAVLHYDLPWNPNRLEQREGRVDRFGQNAPLVKACLLYGSDNPIDGIVLDVLLRKVREIKRSTGITVPFPEDSQSIIDTITQSLLLNPEREIERKRTALQIQLDFGEDEQTKKAKANITRMVDEAAEREKTSRSIFAQNAIKAHEIEEDLRAVDEAIGDPNAVEEFVTSTLNNVFGVQVIPDKKGYRLIPGNLPPQLRDLLPHRDPVLVSFKSPTPEGYHYLGRNNHFVEQLCQLIMANTMARVDRRAARAAVIRSDQVESKTTLLLFRCRNVIEQSKTGQQIVAEEMVLYGWRGSPDNKEFINHSEAKTLLAEARATSNLSNEARSSFLENELKLINQNAIDFNHVAEGQSTKLVEAHERFSSLVEGKKFQVVYPVLPMDLLGIYVILPDSKQN
ncbi:DEAD/DEAH box helicase [bacterium]|nr:DEAD/DEAH box helicase [bacterium]